MTPDRGLYRNVCHMSSNTPLTSMVLADSINSMGDEAPIEMNRGSWEISQAKR